MDLNGNSFAKYVDHFEYDLECLRLSWWSAEEHVLGLYRLAWIQLDTFEPGEISHNRQRLELHLSPSRRSEIQSMIDFSKLL